HEMNFAPGYSVHTAALDAALRAVLPGKIVGVSTYGPARPISIWMDDSAIGADDTAAAGIAALHDPVFLSADKDSIQADGSDTVTLMVTTTNPAAAGVSLLINGAAVPVTLNSGAGTVQIASADPLTITVSVQDPANRSTDHIVI